MSKVQNDCGVTARVKKVMFGYCVIYVILILVQNVFQKAQTLLRSFFVVPALINPVYFLISFVQVLNYILQKNTYEI